MIWSREGTNHAKNICWIAEQKPLSAALAVDKTSVVSRAKLSVASEKTPRHHNEIDNTLRGRLRRPPSGMVDGIEMSGVFSAAATDVLALDTTYVLDAVRARPKAERRRPSAFLKRPAQHHTRRSKVDVVAVRPALDCIVRDWTGLDWMVLDWIVLDCIV